MRFLLSGADGFTGRHLRRYLQGNGHDVHALDVDLTDRRLVLAEVARMGSGAGIDFVIHLAAVAFANEENSQAYYAVNTLGAINLLDGLTQWQRKPLKVVLASSANVYAGVCESVLHEGSLVSPKNHYGMSKLAMEFMARNYFDAFPVVIARPFNYTGPGQELKFVIPKIADHFIRREKEILLGNLDTWREYNDVRMVCEAYFILATRGIAGEVYNISSGRAYRLRDVLSEFERVTGHHLEVRLDERLMRVNEPQSLRGSPEKIASIGMDVERRTLRSTLEWMLSQ